MSADRTFVIVGGGLAGARAAETLRSEGFDGRIVLFAAEDERPYERPPLSKDYLRGESEAEKMRVHPAAFESDHDIDLRLGTPITAIDVARRTVAFGEERLPYDALLLATGAAPRHLEVAGADLEGVCYLREKRDADVLRGRLVAGAKVVVVGAGWIGCEVAASARQLGCEVTLVAPEQIPLERFMGAEMGALYADVHREKGVELKLGTGIEAILGAGAVAQVRTSGGDIECDTVVVGIGVTPRVELARAAGIEVGDGVVVDSRLATTAADIYACGDIASVPNERLGQRVRVEHWANARNTGAAAARSMLGSQDAYDRVPYFFSDQFDLGMEFAGDIRGADRMVIRGDLASREVVAFWLAGSRLVAGMNVNVWDVSDDIQALIRDATPVDEKKLTDPDVPIAEVGANSP